MENNNKKPTYKLINQKQLEVLEIFFDENQNPNEDQIEKLSDNLNLSLTKLKRWFYKRRIKAQRYLSKDVEFSNST